MKNKILRASGFFALLLLLFQSPLQAENYKRIISLAPSVTESLYELGLDGQVIAVTAYCPKGKSEKEIIGTLLEPDIEKIVLLKPDLIVSTKEGNSKAAVEKMQRLGFNVFVMEISPGFKEICSNFSALAAKVGKKEEALKIVEKAEREVLRVYSRAASNDVKQKVFWEIGAKPLYTAGKESFVNDYNYYTFTENIYKDIDMRYFSVSVEDVIGRNPEIIVMVNMGDVGNEEIKAWKKYSSVSAAAAGKIYMIDANDIFTPTPSTFASGVRLLAGVLFPELFNGRQEN